MIPIRRSSSPTLHFLSRFVCLLLTGCQLNVVPGCLSRPSQSPKSFNSVLNPDGHALCGTGKPSATFSSAGLQALSLSTPMEEAVCAWKCTSDENCTSFNWKKSNLSCELFNLQPNSSCSDSSVQCGCTLFHVSQRSISSECDCRLYFVRHH